MFTVRKMSGGIGVERVFPLYSPFVDKIEVTKRGKVRRAKLFYLRGLRGNAARIKEKVTRQNFYDFFFRNNVAYIVSFRDDQQQATPALQSFMDTKYSMFDTLYDFAFNFNLSSPNQGQS